MLQERDITPGVAEQEAPEPRRLVLKASLATLAAFGTGSYSTLARAQAAPISDANILNFALNLEYLEAEFYLRAVGQSLTSGETTGTGTQGSVVGGRQVPFQNTVVQQFAQELAQDERNHVNFLRGALGAGAVAEPAINFTDAFNGLARAAGLGNSFDPFASEANFIVGSFVFEDVGVTAYKGGSRFIQNKNYLEAAAGILAVEAYHAGVIRLLIAQNGLTAQANAISNLRNQLGGGGDQGVTLNGVQNLVPTDANSIAFSRTPSQVLSIVYAGGQANNFGFFPNRVNGAIN